jgi:hypothetical protein
MFISIIDLQMLHFVATSGNITDEVIMEYINNQKDRNTDVDFSITQS